MRRLTLTFAAAVLAALPAMAKPPEPGIRWQHSWEDAVKEAKERNVPIHVTFHKDNCPKCTGMDASVYNQKDFIAASKRWVNVYCNRDTGHGTEKVDGKDMCKLVPGIACADHVACDSGASAGGYFKGTFGTPATVWCDVTGKQIGQNQGGMSAKQLIEKMAEAEKAVGVGLGEDEYLFLTGKLSAGEKSVTDGKIHDAVDGYTAAIKAMAKNPAAKPWVEKAQAALDKLVEGAKSRIEDAVKAKDAGDFAKAKEILKSVQTDFKGQPVAKDADKAMADVLAADKAANPRK
ncbi:MAG: thioredoxin family protein [Planctomycetes bacterium]|nr:thioredoxin family protein [Planctomycetota bacterium]